MRRLHQPAALPAVGRLLNEPAYQRLRARFGHALLADALRAQLELERGEGAVDAAERPAAVERRLESWTAPRLRPVINATGVVLHTNLGRAPLARAAAEAVARVAEGYANVELDLATGRRGERASIVSDLLRRLTGCEAALAVNNNAGAILLALSALGRGREVVVSRGQQVEIGGAFRMPDVMRLSGARMVEVGTTNRTRPADYEDAVGPRTAALLRVHTSNYRVTGFTESVPLEAMAEIAGRQGVLLIDDLGSGALEPVADEPTVAASVAVADVVTFSGDKLAGGPQAGIIVGRAEPLRRIARHPLARALRIDKLTMAALEATLRERLLGRPLPVQEMLGLTAEELRGRAQGWLDSLAAEGVRGRLLEAESAAGGGSLPEHGLPTVLVALEGPASRLARRLREGDPPVIARIEAGACCLDPRTVPAGETAALLAAVVRAARAGGG